MNTSTGRSIATVALGIIAAGAVAAPIAAPQRIAAGTRLVAAADDASLHPGVQAIPNDIDPAVVSSDATMTHDNGRFDPDVNQDGILDIGDFVAFHALMQSGNPAANCDRSVTPPVLNIADYSCFIQLFAQSQSMQTQPQAQDAQARLTVGADGH
jgi:hypothetical protein